MTAAGLAIAPHDEPYTELDRARDAAATVRYEKLEADRRKRRRERAQLQAIAAELLKRGFLPPPCPPVARSAPGPSPVSSPELDALAAVRRAVRSGSADPLADLLARPELGLKSAAERADLDKATPNVSLTGEAADRANLERRKRYALQGTAQKVTRRRRLQWCGRQRTGETVDLCMTSAGRASFIGVMRCGNRWICPDCMARIGGEDSQSVKDLCERHQAAGGDVAFLTLTLPHDYGDSLPELRKTVAGGFRRILTGKGWQETRAKMQIVGAVRSLEATVGPAGFHPHLHILFLTEKPLTRGGIEALRRYAFRHWKTYVTRRGLRPPRPGLCPIKHGTAGAAAYISKLDVALELTRPDKKQGRRSGRTPFQVLADYQQNHNPADLAIWRQWESGIRGARALTWTRGLRERYGIPKRSDREKVVLETVGAVCALELDPGVWAKLRDAPGGEPRVKEAAELGYSAPVAITVTGWLTPLEAAGLAAETEIFAILREERDRRRDALFRIGGVGPPGPEACAAA